MKTKKQIKEISENRRYRGMPVREAKVSLKVQPDQEDIKNAKRGDPTECVYALCLKRVLHTDSVFIYRDIAYVGTLDEKGNKIFERYRIGLAAKRYIDLLDSKGNEHVIPAGCNFNPPPKSSKLDYQLKHENRSPGTTRKKKMILGTKAYKIKPKELSFHHLRKGTGMVQFISRKEDEKVTTQKKKHINVAGGSKP